MPKIRTFTVVPALPAALQPLRDLVYNLWWSWNPDAIALFRRLDAGLWKTVNHNPIQFLAQIKQDRLLQASKDVAFLAHQQAVVESLQRHMGGETWIRHHHPELDNQCVAYFSMEFGLHESLPIYAGGLGVLSGDLIKSSSDLGVPLVAVGLLYRQGYFHQRLTGDGWQLEDYSAQDLHQTPVQLVRDGDGKTVLVKVPIGEHDVVAQVWRSQVGRVPLFLLDTDLPSNSDAAREITQRLYAGDKRMRIRQEIVLGIGGWRALTQLAITPAVCHMNEGHSAFAALERIAQTMADHDLGFADAREAVAASNVFTTHTPVPAGIDMFEPKLAGEMLARTIDRLGLSTDEFLAMGRLDRGGASEPFNMAILALRLSGAANGVSKLHGRVARRMWAKVWPETPTSEVPITSITNGIHIRSWVAVEMGELFDQYLGRDWQTNSMDPSVWAGVPEIPDSELWAARQHSRERLMAFARRRLRQQYTQAGAPPMEIKRTDQVLDPEALTIGFARRFAPYKRANLILYDTDRLKRILTHSDRPVQIVFAGKAHPQDTRGKEIIKQVIAFARQPDMRRHVVYLEDYDINVARHLVQGVDVWLNTPQMLHEASGTSGMKVCPNGGLNLSVLDGWWGEAYDGSNGWAIGDGQVHDDQAYQDMAEAESVYDLLEKEIVPTFYERGAGGVPETWVQKVKASIQTLTPAFSMDRMVAEYADQLYAPATTRWVNLSRDAFANAKQLAQWKQRIASLWGQVKILSAQANTDSLSVGTEMTVTARVHLGAIDPKDVSVEIHYGPIDASNAIIEGKQQPMHCSGAATGSDIYRYKGTLSCDTGGEYGYAVRVLPNHPDLSHRHEPGLICWG